MAAWENIMQEFLENIGNILNPYAWLIACFAVLIALILMVLVVILFAKNRRLSDRMDLFMKGTGEESLEGALRRVVEDNQKVKIQLRNNVNEIVKINENLLTAYRKIGVVKYNAFPGLAGKISSSIALLNNEGNGIIITTLHSQDGCYTYIKEIMNGRSINPLTKEDEEALKIALQTQV